MHDQRFSHLIADREHRIERGHRLLKDERDAGAPYFSHPAFVERQEILSLEDDAAAGDAAGRLNQAHDGQRGHRLAAARFADESERFTRLNFEGYIVDGG